MLYHQPANVQTNSTALLPDEGQLPTSFSFSQQGSFYSVFDLISFILDFFGGSVTLAIFFVPVVSVPIIFIIAYEMLLFIYFELIEWFDLVYESITEKQLTQTQIEQHQNLTFNRQNIELDFWMSRCSICFDSNYEFYFSVCRDQFCRKCFNKYVETVVGNSWGLDVTNIECPVCKVVLRFKEWSKYVSNKTVNVYIKLNNPYKPLKRYCTECDGVLMKAKCLLNDRNQSLHENKLLKQKLLGKLEEIIKLLMITDRKSVRTIIDDFNHHYNYLTDLNEFESTSPVNYTKTIHQILRYYNHRIGACSSTQFETNKNMSDLYETMYAFSSMLMSVEPNPIKWKNLQFLHIGYFPKVICHQCKPHKERCVYCGDKYHENISCIQHKKKVLHSIVGNNSEAKDNLKWIVENSKACPSCKILINREEGCNKVNCLYCGFKFCWVCLNVWSEKCGYFKCQKEQRSLRTSSFHSNITEPELGIPDVHFLERRFNSN